MASGQAQSADAVSPCSPGWPGGPGDKVTEVPQEMGKWEKQPQSLRLPDVVSTNVAVITMVTMVNINVPTFTLFVLQ